MSDNERQPMWYGYEPCPTLGEDANPLSAPRPTKPTGEVVMKTEPPVDVGPIDTGPPHMKAAQRITAITTGEQ